MFLFPIGGTWTVMWLWHLRKGLTFYSVLFIPYYWSRQEYSAMHKLIDNVGAQDLRKFQSISQLFNYLQNLHFGCSETCWQTRDSSMRSRCYRWGVPKFNYEISCRWKSENLLMNTCCLHRSTVDDYESCLFQKFRVTYQHKLIWSLHHLIILFRLSTYPYQSVMQDLISRGYNHRLVDQINKNW